MNFTLTTFHHITGIGSASGLVLREGVLFIIADSSGWLFEYNVKSQTLGKTLLFENPLQANIPKKQKPDFEAITNFGDDVYIFGSGSTENRNKMAHYNLSDKTVTIINLSKLYLRMQKSAAMNASDFNIEGAVFNGEAWYFLQRGNGQSGKNGIFKCCGKNLEDDSEIEFTSYGLPKIKNISATFTDAVLVDNNLYFLAAAEDSKSTYEDGELLGSLIGCIDLHSMAIAFTQKISDSHKFEGITLYQKTHTEIEFLICEDNDTERLESDIFKLSLI